jgi:hypothetical protein
MSTKRPSREVTVETGLVVHRRRGRARVEVRRLLGDIDEDCMSVVFRFLDWRETLRIAHVCRSWYNTTMTRKAFSGNIVMRLGLTQDIRRIRNPLSGVDLHLYLPGTFYAPIDNPFILNATDITCSKLSDEACAAAPRMRQVQMLSVAEPDENVLPFVRQLHKDSIRTLGTLKVHTMAARGWDDVDLPKLESLTVWSNATDVTLRFIERHARSLRLLHHRSSSREGRHDHCPLSYGRCRRTGLSQPVDR